MSSKKIFWGLGFILLAVVLILDAVGLTVSLESTVGELSLLTLFAACLLVAYLVYTLVRGRIGRIFLPLAFLFLLFERNISIYCGRAGASLINNWLVVACALLLGIGVSMLVPSGLIGIRVHGGERFRRHRKSLSTSVLYIDAAKLKRESIENNLGSMVVRFENAESYLGDGMLYIENNLGSIVVEVPSAWRYVCHVENNLGYLGTENNRAATNAPALTVAGENNLGSIKIRLV